MQRTMESMHGKINDLQNSVAQLLDLLLRTSSPRCGSGSTNAKRVRVEDQVNVEETDTTAVAEAQTPTTAFNNHFKKPTSGYTSRSLASKLVEEFVYDWYAKGLGTVQGTVASLHTARWDITVWVKICNDNMLDAKHIMLLTEKIASEAELKVFKSTQPNAAMDSTYTGWEMTIKSTIKSVVKVLGEFLVLKEGKTGNAKAYTIGALARRWKNLKYPVPTADELQTARDTADRVGGKKSSSSSSSSKR